MTRIGLGCVTFGREIDEAAAHELLDHAYARGVTFFDTAAAYSQGGSERIIGRWLDSRRPPAGTVTIATKIQPPYEPGRLSEVIEQSRQRLGVETIDLLYLHQWDATAESIAVLEALDGLVRSGRVRSLGASNYSCAQLATSIALQQQHGFAPFQTLQNNHNFAVRDVTPELLQWCAARGITIVTYSPLGAGFLTGKHRHGVQPGSRFDLVPGHQAVYFHPQARQRLARLEQVAAQAGQTQAHLALAWALHQPGIAWVLVGGRTPAHLDQALAAQKADADAWLAELEDAEVRSSPGDDARNDVAQARELR